MPIMARKERLIIVRFSSKLEGISGVNLQKADLN
jgi:hypothetical protein